MVHRKSPKFDFTLNHQWQFGLFVENYVGRLWESKNPMLGTGMLWGAKYNPEIVALASHPHKKRSSVHMYVNYLLSRFHQDSFLGLQNLAC